MSPEKKPTKPIDIYCRVSQSKGRGVEQEGGSIAEQERRCREHLSSKGLQVGEVFREINQSGGKMSRPEFDKVIQRIKDGVTGGLIMINLARFGRTMKAVDLILELEKKYDAAVISIDDNFDTTTPPGRAVLKILVAFREMELENLTEAAFSGRVRAIERGAPIGTTIPVGYVEQREEYGSKTRRVPMTKHPEYAAIVLEGFKKRAEGIGVSEIARFFDAAGLPTKSGKPWTASGVSYLLKNPAYRGVARHGNDERLINRNAHEAIVSASLWKQVQTVNEAAKRGKTVITKDSFLRGLVRCGSCGSPLVKSQTSKIKNGERKVYRSYTCSSGRCKKKATVGNRATLEAFVLQQLIREHELMVEDGEIVSSPEHDALVERLIEIEDELADLTDRREELHMSPVELAEALAPLREERTTLETQLASFEKTLKPVTVKMWLHEFFVGDPDEGELLDAIDAIQAGVATDEQKIAVLRLVELADGPQQIHSMLKSTFESIVLHQVGKGAKVAIEDRVTIHRKIEPEAAVITVPAETPEDIARGEEAVESMQAYLESLSRS